MPIRQLWDLGGQPRASLPVSSTRRRSPLRSARGFGSRINRSTPAASNAAAAGPSIGTMGVTEDLDGVAEPGRAVVALTGYPDSLDGGHRLLDRPGEPVPAVGVRHRSTPPGGTVAPHVDRRGWLLEWTGPRLDPGERHELTLEARLVLAPHRAHGVEVLHGFLTAVIECVPQRPEFGFEIPDAHPEEQSALREDIDAGHLLGQNQRVALGEDDDAGAQLDGRGARGDERQRNGGIEERGQRPDGRGRNLRVGEHHVLAGPDGLEPGGLGRLGDLAGHIGVGADAGVDGEESEFHWLMLRRPLGLHARVPSDQ